MAKQRVVERRRAPRFAVVFPALVANRLYGSTVDLSVEGARLELPASLDMPVVDSVHLKLAESHQFDIPVQVIWRSPISTGRIAVGVRFCDTDRLNPDLLTEVCEHVTKLDRTFVAEAENIRVILQETKTRCDDYDQAHSDEEDSIEFLEEIKQGVFELLDSNFAKMWALYSQLPEESRKVHQKHYQLMLHDLVEEQVEINRHIYRKPFGYPGDFMIMNYIYSYNDGTYLGRSTFERLINHYTCNIPISKSNIGRKEFLKKQILDMLTRKAQPAIMSIGSGPLRELLELFQENKISKTCFFTCVDFEPKALAYVHDELEKLDVTQRQLISIRYVQRNVVAILRNKLLLDELGYHDLIYASGIYDYLPNRSAATLTHQFYYLLREGGRLLIVNASLPASSHRAYYELLGEWNMRYRTEADMQKWIRDPLIRQKVCFEKFPRCPGYLILAIDKTS